MKTFKTFLHEEAFRQHAIFILGKSASGKSGLSRILSSLYHIPIVDSDHFYEPLLFKNKISLDSSKHTPEDSNKAKELRSKAIEESRKEWETFSKRKISFIYTGLGNQIGWVNGMVDKFTALGYACHIIFMDVSLEEAKKRNQTRERKVPESVITRHSELPHTHFVDSYVDMVGEQNFLYVNNEKSYDIDTIIPVVDRWVD
jgi:predicted kinase